MTSRVGIHQAKPSPSATCHHTAMHPTPQNGRRMQRLLTRSTLPAEQEEHHSTPNTPAEPWLRALVRVPKPYRSHPAVHHAGITVDSAAGLCPSFSLLRFNERTQRGHRSCIPVDGIAVVCGQHTPRVLIARWQIGQVHQPWHSADVQIDETATLAVCHQVSEMARAGIPLGKRDTDRVSVHHQVQPHAPAREDALHMPQEVRDSTPLSPNLHRLTFDFERALGHNGLW